MNEIKETIDTKSSACSGLNFFLFALAAAIFQQGWGSEPTPLNESKLDEVANYYYRPGKETNLPSADKYYFLSKDTKTQMSLAEWVEYKKDDKDNYTSSVSVLGSKDVGGIRFAVVSVGLQMPDDKGNKIKTIISHTWVLENDKWRNLNLQKTKVEFDRKFRNGDLVGAQSAAEEWLKKDPFSIEAYSDLGNVVDRIGPYDNPVSTTFSKDEIVRTLLTINPDDTTVLVYAVSWSKTVPVAKSYLKQLEGTNGYQCAAFNFANSHLDDMEMRLEFLKGMAITPDLALLKLQALALLLDNGSKKVTQADFQKVASTEGSFDKLKSFLDKSDSAFAIDWADKLFHFFIDAKDIPTAQKWREYRITRRKNDTRFKAFLSEGQTQDTGHYLLIP